MQEKQPLRIKDQRLLGQDLRITAINQ